MILNADHKVFQLSSNTNLQNCRCTFLLERADWPIFFFVSFETVASVKRDENEITVAYVAVRKTDSSIVRLLSYFAQYG